MFRRAVTDRQHNGAHSRQMSLLDLGDPNADSPPENSPIKPRRGRSSQQATNALQGEQLREQLMRIEARVNDLQRLLYEVHDRTVRGAIIKEYYTTQEVAQLLKKRPYTVREWCRLGRVQGEKSHSGRGLDEEWRISHEELTRIQNEGLLPLQRHTAVTRPRRLK